MSKQENSIQIGDKILVIHGPNLNLLGIRERNIYGGETLEEINTILIETAEKSGYKVVARQSNSEGEIIEFIQTAKGEFGAIIINPAAFTHTSVAIRDALLAVSLPTVEVHMSNIHKREEFRKHSYISDVVDGTIAGFGATSYILGLEALMHKLNSPL